MSIKIYNEETGQWEIKASNQASMIEVEDVTGELETEDVEGALTSLVDKVNGVEIDIYDVKKQVNRTDEKINNLLEGFQYHLDNHPSGDGVTTVYISSNSSDILVVNKGNDLQIDLNFISPNLGKGTLNVAINNVTAYTTSLPQGETTVVIPERIFTKGVNSMTLYAIDRGGGLSNTLMFEVRYGSLEIKSDFDSYSAYDVQSPVRYYFTPTSADTSIELTFYMKINGEIQDGIVCVSDTRNYYTFPTNLTSGCYKCEAFVMDTNSNVSNVLEFNLVLLDEISIVVASDTKDVVIEEGLQLSLDFKVYMKNNISFITKVYVDNVLVNNGTCGLEKSYYKTSSLTEGEHTVKLEVYNESQTVSDFITWGVIVTESTYTMIQATNSGLIFSATAFNKTNSDEGKEKWIGVDQDGNNIEADLMNFSFNNESGWVDDTLIISGNSYVEIPIAPLSNNATYGFTLDVEFLSKQIGVEDAEVLTLWDNVKNCGVKITTENIILRSAEGNECNLYFSDNELTNVIFVIDRQELKAKIYLNGVMCEAFHLSDYVANGVSYLEDFSVQSNVFLGGANKSGYSQIKNIRIYEVALTTNEILNNFISNKKDKAEQQALVEFQKGNDLPTLTIYCDFSGLGKDDKKPCKIVYNSTDELKYGKSFILDHKESQLQYQGTSSMAYPIKNYRLNLRDENGEKWYYDFPKGQPECRFTLKADFMSSGHWQNTGFTKWVNDNLYNYKMNDEKSMNPKKWFDIHNGGDLDDTRECIYGFPCRLILVNDGKSALNEGQNEPTPGNTKDMGIFNFNHDKDCASTIGFDQVNFPNCASFEISANSDTSAGAFMSYDNIKPENTTELEYLKQSFELRFPDADDVAEDWGFFGTGEEGTGIKALIDWVDNCTDDEFVNEFEQHFHKDYTLRYYLMVMVCGMVDNLGKNLMLDTWDNKIFMPRFYDCDTICSYDNSGDIKFDVDIEMEQGYWNTSSSRLWTRVRDLMYDDLVSKYNDMRQNGLSYESLMSYFYDEQIAKIPEKYYNMDFDVKYAPFANSYMGMAHGNGYEHLKRWLKKRIIFCDTLFDYAPSYNNDVLTIRANTTEPMTIEIETYTPLYQHVSWYNGQMDKKKIDGKVSVTFTGTAMAATDQEVLIYGGSNVKRITGIQSMKPNQMLIGYATKLTEINASNCTILQDINSDGANLSPHIYLNNVNLSNCSQLSGNLRLDNSPLIRNVDISGTAIDGIVLPTNVRNLETLKLSEDVTSLTLRDASLLSSLNLPNNIEYLNLYNIPRLTNITNSSGQLSKLHTLVMENPTINPVSNIISKAPNIQRVRLTGLDIMCASSHMQTIMNTKGVDEFGNEIAVGQAVSGKIRLSSCSVELEQELKTAFPLVEFSVESYVKSFKVTFKDGDGNIVYETNVVENGEAIYVGDTPTKSETAQYVYTFDRWDRSLKPILSDTVINAVFTATTKVYTIKFVNGLTGEVLKESQVAYGSTPSEPALPTDTNAWTPSIVSVTGDKTYVAKYIPYPDDISAFYFANYGSYYSVNIAYAQTSSQMIIPFEYNGKPVKEIYSNSSSRSYLSNITELYIPETITTISNTGPLAGFSSLTEMHIPSSVTNFSGKNLFRACSNVTHFSAPGMTKITNPGSSIGGWWYDCLKLETVTLGSEEHPFTTWEEYSASSQNLHFYNATSNLKYINLVTKNGLASDVAFSFVPISMMNYIIFSKKPIEEYSDSSFKYLLVNDTATIIDFIGEVPESGELEIPTTVKGIPVTKIDSKVFMSYTSLTKVVANSVTTLGNDCFAYCSNLTSIDIPLVTSLGDNCFANCSNLTSIDIPLVTSLGNSCFYNCNKLTSINIPNVTSLGDTCFAYCSSLTSIDIPLVTSLGSYCFDYCTALTSLEFPKPPTTISNNVLGGTTPARVTTITLGSPGNPLVIESYHSTCFKTTYLTSIIIYVDNPADPPVYANSPWGATNATITYEQA